MATVDISPARALHAPFGLDVSLGARLHLSDVLGALSFALDLTEGQPPGHCLRSCWIGMKIGRALDLDGEALLELYYGILLKDAGCSSNAARLCELYFSDDRAIKRDFKVVDSQNIFQVARFVFEHTSPDDSLKRRLTRFLKLARNRDELASEIFKTRCERGADIARRLGFDDGVAATVRCLDEHYNGKGKPGGLAGDEIPIGSRIALVAQVADVFHRVGGAEQAVAEVSRRAATWFDPRVVAALGTAAGDTGFWETLDSPDLQDIVRRLEPRAAPVAVDLRRLESISEAFALVVDAKSPFTFGHSSSVADYTAMICAELNFESEHARLTRCAALLHDVGKLGVSNAVLDKPGKLDEDEFEAVKKHAVHSEEILSRIPSLGEFARVAAAHHERLNGCGYPRGLRGDQICVETRILAVADVFDALTAKRPYRDALPLRGALEIMERDRGSALDSVCLDALLRSLESKLPAVAFDDPDYVLDATSRDTPTCTTEPLPE